MLFLNLFTAIFPPHLHKFLGRPTFCVYRQQVFCTVILMKYGSGFHHLATLVTYLSSRIQLAVFKHIVLQDSQSGISQCFLENTLSTIYVYILYINSTRMVQLLYSSSTLCSTKAYCIRK